MLILIIKFAIFAHNTINNILTNMQYHHIIINTNIYLLRGEVQVLTDGNADVFHPTSP